MTAHEYRMSVESPRADVYRIRVRGVLDTATGARALRQVDARLRLLDEGHVGTRHILLDLTEVTDATPKGLRGLWHGHYTSARRGVGFALVGAGHLYPGLGPAGHALLARIGGFPDLDSALAHLPAHDGCLPVETPTEDHPVSAETRLDHRPRIEADAHPLSEGNEGRAGNSR